MPEMTPAEAWAAKSPPPSSESDDSPAAKWAAKFPKDPSITHQEHLEAVGNAVANVHQLAAQLQQKLNPVPIPGMLDNTTPDPRGILTRTWERDKDAAAKIAGGLSDVRNVGNRENSLGGGEPGPTGGEVVAGGLHHAAEGAMTLLEPLMGAGLATAPLATMGTVGTGMLAQEGTTAGLSKLGVAKPYADLAGDVAGLAVGAKAHSMFEGADSLAVKAWKSKFGEKAAEVLSVEGSSQNPGQAAEAKPAAEAQGEPAAVRVKTEPRTRPASPFGDTNERNPEAPEVAGEPEAPRAAKTVRMYHGGDESSFPIKEPRFFSSHKDYAQGYADKSPRPKVVYVDLPEDHPLIAPEYPDQSIGAGFHRNVELPFDLAGKAQDLTSAKTPEAPKPAPVDEALVRKRPLLDEDGEPLKTKAGKVREREFGTKINLDQQPEIAKALDEKAAARATVKGEAPDVRSATMREHVGKLNDAIEKGEPVHAVYDSSKVDHEGLIDPAAREAEHQARIDNPTLSQAAQKSFVPESYSRSAGGDVLVHGRSLDKWMSNGEKLQTMAADAKLKTPYAPESAGVEMALDLRKPFESLPKAKQNFWELARQGSPGSVFQKALEKRGVDPIDSLEQVKETLRLDRIEKILGTDEEGGVDAIRASVKTGTLKTPVDRLTPMVKAAKAKVAAAPESPLARGRTAESERVSRRVQVPDEIQSVERKSGTSDTGLGPDQGKVKPEETPLLDIDSKGGGKSIQEKPSVPKSDADLEAKLQASIEQAQAKKAAKAEPGEPRFTTEPAYGRAVNIAVPGEQTRYKARYALREASDVQASHNAQSFEANPEYEHQNERDYSNPQNAARVVRDSSKDVFDPEFITSESPTAEHGPTVVDARGNALGGNSRAMVVKRVYAQNGAVAARYRGALEEKIAQFGISPDDLQRFKDPVLVRERIGPVDATTEVADYNRKAAADLTPSEQAVADGKRISDQTMGKIMGNLESGDRESLADALRGDNGAEILNALERDGVVSPQEKGGLVDDRGGLTPLAKDRIAKAMVGRMFESSGDFERTTPEMRAKLEKIAPHVARVESREGWSITGKIREALGLIEEMRAAGTKNVEQFLKQDSMLGEKREYSPEAQAIAKTLAEKGQNQGAMSFRRYANEEANSRPGAPGNLFEPLTQKQAFEDAFVKRRGEAGSAPMLVDLVQHIKEKLDGPDVGLEQNYSGVGSAESKLVRNLGQVKRAAPEVVAPLLRAASPNAQATVKMMIAAPKIEKALGPDLSLNDFKRVMIQDRLNAIRDTWDAWAKDAGSLDDNKLVAGLKKGVNGLLWAMEDKNGLPGNLVETAGALAEAEDYEGLRSFLGDTFGQASRSVRDVMSPEDFVEHSNKSGFQKGLDVYKAELEPMLEANQAKREGAFSTARGEFDTYYPLEPLMPKDKAALKEWNSTQARPNPFKELLNQQAGKSELGLSGEYDPASKVLKERLSESFRSRDKAAAIDALQKADVMRELPAGSEPGRAYDFNGTPLKSTTMQIGFKRYEVPEAFARELKPILDPQGEKASPGAVAKVMNALNTVAVTGLAEPVYHSYNIMGTLISRVPFIGKTLGRSAGEVPFVRPFYWLTKLASTEAIRGDHIGPENISALQWLAEHGALGERYGTATRSRALAEITGGEVHRYSLGPSLYGPKGIDMRARIEMYKASQLLDPKASIKDRVEFINQLGQYTKALQGEVERAIKTTGLSPFYTAGSTMLRNGIANWTNTGPKLGMRSAGAQVAHMLTKGAVGTVSLWALTYRAYTGKWPWQDSRSKLLQIPVNSKDRYSKVGRMMWGTGAEQGYVNFGFFNPLIGRGGRALGVSGAYESHVLGGTKEQMADAAEKDILNSFAHPVMGPVAKALFTGATGNEPYLTGLRDDRGKMAPQFWNVTHSGGVAARGLAAMKELNSFYGNLGAATGMLSTEREVKGNQWLRMITDLALPGAIGKPSDPYKKQQFVEKQARGMERAQEKERK